MPVMTVGTGRALLGIVGRYLLLDQFLTDSAAPLATPRVCEPGPGVFVVNQPANMSISGGLLVASAGVADKGVVSVDSYLYAPSRAHGFSLHSITAGGRADISVGTSGTEYQIEPIGGTNTSLFVRFPSVSILVGLFTTSYPFAVWLIRRSGGGLFYVINGTLRWIHNGTDFSAWKMRINSPVGGWAFTADNAKIVDFGGIWTSEYGLSTSRLNPVVSGDETTSMANAIIEFTWTPAVLETLEIDVRRIDDDNRWIIQCSEPGSTIKLIERNAGVDTERDSDAQIWVVGTSYRIMIAMNGTDMRNWVNNVAKNVYTSASFNQAETGVKVSGFATGSNLICWPIDVSAHIPGWV